MALYGTCIHCNTPGKLSGYTREDESGEELVAEYKCETCEKLEFLLSADSHLVNMLFEENELVYYSYLLLQRIYASLKVGAEEEVSHKMAEKLLELLSCFSAEDMVWIMSGAWDGE